MRYDKRDKPSLISKKFCKPSNGKGNNHKHYWIAIQLGIYEDNILSIELHLTCFFIEVLYNNDKLRY